MLEHGHDPDGGPPLAPSGSAVVLDIGGDIGAVVVYLGDQRVGEELVIEPLGQPSARFHTGVHPRVIDGVPTRVAIFPEMVTGRYQVLDEEMAPLTAVGATGGEVCTIDLR